MSKKGTKAFDAEWIVILALGLFLAKHGTTEHGTTTDLTEADGRKTRWEGIYRAELACVLGFDGVVRQVVRRRSIK